MKKITLLPVLLMLILSLSASAQKDNQKKTISKEEAKELTKQLNIDTIKIFNSLTNEACGCIDTISTSHKDSKDIANDISDCIDKKVLTYLASVKILLSLTDDKRNIQLNTDKKSDEYRRAYYRMETLLRDSCKPLHVKVVSNEKQSQFSVSKNPDAIDQYNEGNKLLREEKYDKALPFFHKAVEIDPEFAFAWDNIGVSNRKLGNYDQAVSAYLRSLSLDPKGITALQNLPVVYELKKEYEKALERYYELGNIYPDNPEAYYGAGRIYIYYIVDLEKGLDNMCKAYNAYIKMSSPYRVDAQKNISYIYSQMKEQNKTEIFMKILKDNNIKTADN